MRSAIELRTLIVGRGTAQGVVLETKNGTALVSTASGTQNAQADIAVAPGDLVTVRGGRIVSKRTSGVGGAVKVYQV